MTIGQGIHDFIGVRFHLPHNVRLKLVHDIWNLRRLDVHGGLDTLLQHIMN